MFGLVSRSRRKDLIFLVGMMGSGKTTLGRRLAERIDSTFVDLDELIEKRAQAPIADVFTYHGEFNFRCCEAQVLRDIPRLHPAGAIVATGGGAPMHFDSMEFMLTQGLVIFLDASAHELIARLAAQRTSRPLLARDDWETYIAEMVDKRRPVYERAHASVKVDGLMIGDVLDRLHTQLPQITGH